MASLVWLATPRGPTTATVLFVHGLGGHLYNTWGSGGSGVLWPTWLATDVPGVAVATIGYAASPTGWTGSSMSLDDRAKSIFSLVEEVVDKADAPIIIVCHSLGGLIIKKMITMAATNFQFGDRASAFIRQLKGVAFYATPHGGAGYGDLADWARFIVWPTPTMSYLTRDNGEIANLNEIYRNWAASALLKHLVVYETKSTLFGWIVRAREADPGIPKSKMVPAEADHFRVCKPLDRSDQRYTDLLKFVRSLVPTSENDGTAYAAPLIHELPPPPRGEPVIIVHVVARLLLILLVAYVAYRGSISIYEDPLRLQLKASLEAKGASADQQTELADKLVKNAKDRNISDRQAEAVLSKNDLDQVEDATEYVDRAIVLFKEISRLRDELNALKVSKDPEVSSFASS
jgi:hypothetical protein